MTEEEASDSDVVLCSDRRRNEELDESESPPKFQTIKAKPAPKFSNQELQLIHKKFKLEKLPSMKKDESVILRASVLLPSQREATPE